MNVTVDTRPENIAVLAFNGRLDLLSASDVKQCLATTVSEGHQKLVVDLADVQFVDSSGLGALIGGLKAARVAGGDLRIARAPEQTRVILALTTLDKVLRLYDSVEEACTGY